MARFGPSTSFDFSRLLQSDGPNLDSNLFKRYLRLRYLVVLGSNVGRLAVETGESANPSGDGIDNDVFLVLHPRPATNSRRTAERTRSGLAKGKKNNFILIKRGLSFVLLGSALVAGDSESTFAAMGGPLKPVDGQGLEHLGLCLRHKVVDGYDIGR